MFAHIHQALQTHQRQVLPSEGLTPAAVLVPLFQKGGEPYLLMARRTDQVLKHKGQIAFPGGVCDPADPDLQATALREAWEEVGLRSSDVEVLGLLGDTRTVTGFRITPVVGAFPYPYPFRTSPAEVEELLEVPWAVFSEGRAHRRETYQFEGEEHETDFYDFQGQVIWGATARITRQLVELVGGRVDEEGG